MNTVTITNATMTDEYETHSFYNEDGEPMGEVTQHQVWDFTVIETTNGEPIEYTVTATGNNKAEAFKQVCEQIAYTVNI